MITVEDHYAHGGLGDAVSEAVWDQAFRVKRLAVREIPRSGQPEELLDRFGISSRGDRRGRPRAAGVRIISAAVAPATRMTSLRLSRLSQPAPRARSSIGAISSFSSSSSPSACSSRSCCKGSWIGSAARRSCARRARTSARSCRTTSRRSTARSPASNARETHLNNALRLSDEILATGKSDIKEIDLGFSLAELNSASWRTAELTGALALMEYRRRSNPVAALRFSGPVRRRTAALAGAPVGGADSASPGDPTKAARADLEAFRHEVLALLAALLHRSPACQAAQPVVQEHDRRRFRVTLVLPREVP